MLDEQVRRDPQSWGTSTWLGPLLALVAVMVIVDVVVPRVVPDDGPARIAAGVAALIGSELLLLAALLAFGRGIAAREGGWRNAFGLDRVRTQDWMPWLLGLGLVYAARTTVLTVAGLLTEGQALDEARNLELRSPTALTIVVLVVTIVVLAPITEELMFRGLVLRSFMRRMSFWPAALLSSLLFAAFHVPQVDTVLGAAVLATATAVLGLANCYLVRITGRLAPAMMVHATFNGLAVLVAVATASG